MTEAEVIDHILVSGYTEEELELADTLRYAAGEIGAQSDLVRADRTQSGLSKLILRPADIHLYIAAGDHARDLALIPRERQGGQQMDDADVALEERLGDAGGGA